MNPLYQEDISFLGRNFYIDETVHRPRLSTEAITSLGYISYLNQLSGQSIVAADIGVGSGVIAISCALECPKVNKIYGVDLYEEALRAAANNIKNWQVENRVELLQGDLFSPLLTTQVDVIIANLPFASHSKLDAIKKRTSKLKEPITGIHGGETGFELYERFFFQLKAYKFINNVTGIWVFCGQEHLDKVNQYHQSQFSSFKLMTFEDKYKPHYLHCLFTKFDFSSLNTL
jgi:HemK-like putative methylase